MKNTELLEILGRKVSCTISEEIHISENKTINMQAGLSGELTAVVFTPDHIGIAIDDSDIFCFDHVSDFKLLNA
jgi:hypothetical protein